MTKCEAKVLPLLNRVPIFGTTDYTYHGHPDPLPCPPGMTRKSLAVYYFSNGRPAEEVRSVLASDRRDGQSEYGLGTQE